MNRKFPDSLVAGPDGAMWFTDSQQIGGSIGRVAIGSTLAITPTKGAPGTVVSVSGAGYTPNEIVSVKYDTGQTSPKAVTICQVAATKQGEFACHGSIPPSAKAGAIGIHTIVATGKSSGASATAPFTLKKS
jgi:hypothetical protein